MHPDLSEHLHNDKCNGLIKLLKECQKDFWNNISGSCGNFYVEVNKCLHDERIEKRQKNLELSEERRKRIIESSKHKEQ